MKLTRLIIAATLLTGCGPHYVTNYTYVKPDTPEGQACAFQCENAKLQCQHNEELKEMRCKDNEERNRREYDICINDKNKKKKDCTLPLTQWCKTNDKRCTASYNSCYVNCGGLVNSETVCVSNCDKTK